MPGDWLHLGRRFFSSLSSPPLTEAEVSRLARWLDPPELELFLDQPRLDQRHGHDAARFVADRHGDRDLIRAAALHDVGKRRARLGIPGRVLASVGLKIGLPLGGRYATYRDHGPIGASELEEIGAPEIAVAYARHHHGSRPPDVDRPSWALLVAADEAGERRVPVPVDR